MNHAAQISFQALVQPLRLAVSLWMVRGAQVQSSICQFKQALPKPASEHFVSVGYQHLWHAMPAVHIVQKGLGHGVCRERVFQWHEVPIFGEFVHYDQDCIKCTRLGQSFDEVQAHRVPRIRWYW